MYPVRPRSRSAISALPYTSTDPVRLQRSDFDRRWRRRPVVERKHRDHVNGTGASSLLANSFSAMSMSDGPSTLSLLSSNNNDTQKQSGANTMVLSAALAAAGLSTAHSAAAPVVRRPAQQSRRPHARKGRRRQSRAVDGRAARGSRPRRSCAGHGPRRATRGSGSRTPVHADQVAVTIAYRWRAPPAGADRVAASDRGRRARRRNCTARISRRRASACRRRSKWRAWPRRPRVPKLPKRRSRASITRLSARSSRMRCMAADMVTTSIISSRRRAMRMVATVTPMRRWKPWQARAAVLFHSDTCRLRHLSTAGAMLPMMDALAVHQDAAPTHG